MSFISYAQNLEDVMLFRALSGIENGFYIDVGANDPIIDSVTKAFYDRGWRGINIEPVQHWVTLLERERQEDVNIKAVVAKDAGVMHFYDVIGTGLSTQMASNAKKHKDAGFTVCECDVPALPLNAVCKDILESTIHFLKIDVEGAEYDVLASVDLMRIRPWIILVEATEPGTTIQNFTSWEHLLTDQDYDFVYFDGLNRFYLANEHTDLRDSFRTPPNCFDNYIRHNDWLEHEHAIQLKAELDAKREHAIQLEAELASIYISRSWKLTKYLRQSNKLVHMILSSFVEMPCLQKNKLHGLLRSYVIVTARYARNHKYLIMLVKLGLRKFPHTEMRLRKLISVATPAIEYLPPYYRSGAEAAGLQKLSPRAIQIRIDIEHATNTGIENKANNLCGF